MQRERNPRSRWAAVETGGKLYLYTRKSIEDYDATRGSFSHYDPPGQPLSKKDCLKLARILLDHGTR
jgi:hypothetical protein